MTTITSHRLNLVVQNWTSLAKCRSLGAAPESLRDLLYPAPRDNKSIAVAKRFCQDCPVALACLRDGVDDLHAVRGGLTADERRRLRDGETTIAACQRCRLPFVPRPTNPELCTGCIGRTSTERVVPEDYREEIITMHKGGSTGEEISAYFGFTRDEIRLAGKRWKVPLMRRSRPECGTPNGARAHYRARQRPCGPCLNAVRAYKADKAVAEQRARQQVAA